MTRFKSPLTYECGQTKMRSRNVGVNGACENSRSSSLRSPSGEMRNTTRGGGRTAFFEGDRKRSLRKLSGRFKQVRMISTDESSVQELNTNENGSGNLLTMGFFLTFSLIFQTNRDIFFCPVLQD